MTKPLVLGVRTLLTSVLVTNLLLVELKTQKHASLVTDMPQGVTPMTTKTKDPLASALDSASPAGTIGNRSRIDFLFADRPEVKKSIIAARRDRKLSYRQIAHVLSQDPDVSISDGAVKNWLDKQGVA